MTQREIKFRVWSKSNEYPKGFMWYPDNPKVPYIMNLSGDLIYDKHVKDFDHILIWARISSTCELMQFTGLKDKNGKDIFEGDICCYTGSGRLFEVWWNVEYARWAATFIFQQRNGELDSIYHYENENSEVIGNIHETPELLK